MPERSWPDATGCSPAWRARDRGVQAGRPHRATSSGARATVTRSSPTSASPRSGEPPRRSSARSAPRSTCCSTRRASRPRRTRTWRRTGVGPRCATRARRCPGLRAIEKAAVRAGGGFNHRERLSDAVLIKDNHLAVPRSRRPRSARAKARWPGRTVEVECDTLDQVREARRRPGADLILLDNMTPRRRCARRSRVGRRPRAARGLGRRHARDRPRLRRHRRRLHLGRRDHPLARRCSTSASTSRLDGGLAVLLAHRHRQHPDRHRPVRRRRELADHWRIATVAERTSDELAADDPAVPRLPRLLVRRRSHRRRDVLGRARASPPRSAR